MLFLTIFFSACSVKLPTYKEVKVENVNFDSAKDKKLAKAFLEYWKARVRGEYTTSYKYELPYQRYIFDYKTYRKQIGSIYPGATVVLTKIEYKAPNVAVVSREVKLGKKVYKKKDKWIYVDGEWYHKFYQNIMPSLKDAEYQ